MTLPEIKTLLEGISGFDKKVVYYAWAEGQAPPLPFIVYFEEGINPMSADGINYYNAKQITIELYAQNKDLTSEAAVEAALTAAGIFYSKIEEYLEDEKVFETIYEIEV